MITTHEINQEFKDNIMNQLRANTMKVTFTKKDGSERVLVCTTNPQLIPESKKAKSDHHSVDVMPVWDTEAQDWRSFRWDAVKDVAVA